MLTDYDFSLHHLPGSQNSAADALFHLPNHNDGSDDNVEVVAMKGTFFEMRATGDAAPLEAHIQAVQDKLNPLVVKALASSLEQWQLDDEGMVWVRGQLYILKDAML
jgi:hypothetical protein